MYARVAGLCRGVKPLLQHLVQNHRGRGAHVERVDLAEQRQRDEVVASMCDDLVSLPLRGRIESLNVSATGAVLLYEMLQQRLDTST